MITKNYLKILTTICALAFTYISNAQYNEHQSVVRLNGENSVAYDCYREEATPTGKFVNKTVGANTLHTNGSLNLNAEGAGHMIGIISANPNDGVQRNHEAFLNPVGTATRVATGYSLGINSSINSSAWHSTVMAGEAAASKIANNGWATGIAPEATIICLNLSPGSISTYFGAGLGYRLVDLENIGCHASCYGYTGGNTNLDHQLDDLPDHFFAAPIGNNGSSMQGYAKSLCAISVGHYPNIGNLDFGATWDNRIKPDIVASNSGVNVPLYSSSSNSDYGITSNDQSSFAVPIVASGGVLLQEVYGDYNSGALPHSSTVKGLMVHTAKELGNLGPETKNGYGLMDLEKAAKVIANDGTISAIVENSVGTSSSNYTYTVTASNYKPIEATLVWLDPWNQVAGSPNAINLVNDLDVKITEGSNTYYPWSLNSSGVAINTVRNERDNVEKVQILNPTPGATYTVTVSYTGTLTNGNGNAISSQDFSLIVTGINNCGGLSTNNNLTFTTAVSSGNITEHANQVVTASNTISGSSTDVEYAAGNEVLLTGGASSGFDAIGSADFDGLIRDCNSQALAFNKKSRYNKIVREPIYYPLDDDEFANVSDFENPNVTVYPNPTDGKVNIDLGGLDNTKIRITTSTGQLISQDESNEQQKTIDLSKHPSGIYFIEITSNNQRVVRKIIKR